MAVGTLVGALVQDTTTTTGTGAITLAGVVPAGAAPGSTTFATQFGTTPQTAPGNTFYVITDGTNFEIGLGTFNGSTTLTRDYILGSYTGSPSLSTQTTSGDHVNFAAGTKSVFSNVNLFGTTVAVWQRIPDDNAANIFQAVMSGTFTINVVQGGTTTPGTCRFKVSNEGMATLSFPAAITANGAAAVCTFTGIPAFLSNLAGNTTASINAVTVNNATVIGTIQIVPGASPTTAGTGNLLSGATLTTVTTSGQPSGVNAGSSFVYPLF